MKNQNVSEDTVTGAPKFLRYADWMYLGFMVLLIYLSIFHWSQLPLRDYWDNLMLGDRVAIITIALMILFSSFLPVHRPLWQRRAYVITGLVLLTPTYIIAATVLPRSNFAGLCSLYTYLFLAKGCFLLPRREALTAIFVTGLGWQIGVALAHVMFIEQLQEALRQAQAFRQYASPAVTKPISWQWLLGLLLRQSFFLLVVYLPFGLLLVPLGLSIVSEYKNRQQILAMTAEAERLSIDLERTRIARDVHDSLGHTLTGLDMQLKLAQSLYPTQPERASQALSRAQDLSRQSLQETRRTASKIHPEVFNLNAALKTLIEQMKQTQTCFIDHHLETPPLPVRLSEQLYMVIKEGLVNVQKHSQASHVSLHVQKNSNIIYVQLSDNGIGFEPQTPKAGFGLQGMRERVESLKGQITLQSTPGEGTTIQITLPYAPDSPIENPAYEV
ncbi:MAG: sensor histidine kinase [Cyanobacteria bacterium J06639_14]